MSNPTPSSFTKNTDSPSRCSPPKLTCAGSRLRVNFQLLPRRFVRAMRSSRSSQVADNGTRHLRQVHAERGHLVARESREQQHVVDEAAHAPGRDSHAVEVLPTIVAQHRALVLEQDLAEAVDAAQG